MRRLVAGTVAVALLVLLAACGSTSEPGARTTSPPAKPGPAVTSLPDIALADLHTGDQVALSTFAGKPTIINLWASWCGPCKAELPVLAEMASRMDAKVRFVGIDFADENPAGARALAKKSGIGYRLLADPDSRLRKDLQVIGLPQTVFVDARGTIVATERRAFDSESELRAALETHLGVTP